FVDRAFGRIAGKSSLAVRDLLDDLLGRKVLDQLALIHAQRAEGSKARFESGVVNFLGMQLLVDPFVDAHGGYAVNLKGPRAKREAVQPVDSALGLVHRGRGFLFLLGRELLAANSWD